MPKIKQATEAKKRCKQKDSVVSEGKDPGWPWFGVEVAELWDDVFLLTCRSLWYSYKGLSTELGTAGTQHTLPMVIGCYGNNRCLRILAWQKTTAKLSYTETSLLSILSLHPLSFTPYFNLQIIFVKESDEKERPELRRTKNLHSDKAWDQPGPLFTPPPQHTFCLFAGLSQWPFQSDKAESIWTGEMDVLVTRMTCPGTFGDALMDSRFPFVSLRILRLIRSLSSLFSSYDKDLLATLPFPEICLIVRTQLAPALPFLLTFSERNFQLEEHLPPEDY